MPTITRIYRTGSPRHWTIALDCGHKYVVENAMVKQQQLYVGKSGQECAECPKPLDLDTVVAAMKREILEYASSRIIPTEVKSFSDLHDFMDANLLGLPEGYVFSNDDTDLLNQAQDQINQWIAAGGLKEGK